MSNSLKVLIEGYAYENEDGSWNASPSTTLINTNGVNVLVDPGANIQLLKDSLNNNKLTTQDIDIIFLTHYHPDHILNIRLFPEHKIYDGGTIYDSDHESFFEKVIPSTDIKLLPTPGHTSEHTALLVEVEGEMYCIAQDVFWWVDGEQDNSTEEALLNLVDPFAQDIKQLLSSRKIVLEKADWIIPGHGKMFKNPLRK